MRLSEVSRSSDHLQGAVAQCKRQGGQPSLDCRSPFGNRQDGLGLGFRGLGVRVEGLGISKPVCLRFLVEAEAPWQVEAVQLLIWRRGLAAASESFQRFGIWELRALRTRSCCSP